MAPTTHLLGLLLTMTCVSAVRHHLVFWNTTNPVFRIDNTDNIVDVNQDNLPWEYDQLNIICPISSAEKHVIYSVSKDEFDSCRVSNPRPKIVAVCDRPHSFQYFTITFRSFSPSPGGLEFKPGHNYYFVSTSNRNDVHRRVGGYCSSHNMKMVFKIADNTEKSNHINVNQPRKPFPTTTTTTTTTTTPRPVYWSARVPEHRQDYIYYYKPWDTARRVNTVNNNNNIYNNQISDNTISALPLTSSSVLSLPSIISVIFTMIVLIL